MTLVREMLDNISQWLRTHTLGVGGYVGVSSFFAQIHTPITKLGAIVGTLGTVNVVLAFAIGAITLVIKGWELYEKIAARFRAKRTAKHDTDGPTNE